MIFKHNGFQTGKAFNSMVVGIFLMHPNIVNYMFKNFKCVDLDGSLRLEEDFEIECW